MAKMKKMGMSKDAGAAMGPMQKQGNKQQGGMITSYDHTVFTGGKPDAPMKKIKGAGIVKKTGGNQI